MQFRDIVNREAVNLTNCEQEPIHIPGTIQPHGFLIGLKEPLLTIDFCSANCFDHLQLPHDELLGKNFIDVFGQSITSQVTDYIGSTGHSSSAPLEIKLGGKYFSCSIQTNSEGYLLELEPVFQEDLAVADIYRQTKQFTPYMEKATTLESLCKAVADETRVITGYDRVMIYKFDEDYNGEVFAESRKEELEPFLGLHYPHTDIPAQARELYIKNLLRLIPDVYYTPVPIYTINDCETKNLDLSLSILRSVSPIHIQYLQNMGVGATLTISLIHNQKLWGLIACHHYSPKYISMQTRIAAQLQGHFLTSQIPVREDAEEIAVARKANKALEELLGQVFSSESISLEKLATQTELLDLTNAAGVIISVDDEIYSNGNVPAEDEIRKLVSWLDTYSSPTGFNTKKLLDFYPDANKCASASGILFHSLGSGPNNCIIWCRPEALQEVHWAGDPKKAIEKDENGLSPRKSFQLWKEVKKCESLPWQKAELAAASNFANALQKHVHMLFLSKEELKQRKLSERPKEANAELENINWIGSHDLKEPLRKIQMFASRILDDEHEVSSVAIIDSVKRMRESANRMQSLLKDILAYSSLTRVKESYTIVDLNLLVKDVIDDLAFEIDEKKAVIEFSGLPKIYGVPFLLHQLLINLLRNALKFSKADTLPEITIKAEEIIWSPGEVESPIPYYQITITDNGIGFDNQYNESIFKVFTRLHKTDEYPGTGVGLALCRKIMLNHNGYIIAEGLPGIGASFILYFRK